MIRTGTINAHNISKNYSLALSTNCAIKGYAKYTPQQDFYPLLDLPTSLQGIYFYNSKLVFKPYQLFPYNPKVGNVPLPEVTVYLPNADKILTEYGEKYLKLRFTIEVLKFNGVKAGIPQSSTENDKWGVKYSIDIMKALNKESAGTTEESYEHNLQKVLGFYTGHQAFIYEITRKQLL